MQRIHILDDGRELRNRKRPEPIPQGNTCLRRCTTHQVGEEEAGREPIAGTRVRLDRNPGR